MGVAGATRKRLAGELPPSMKVPGCGKLGREESGNHPDKDGCPWSQCPLGEKKERKKAIIL